MKITPQEAERFWSKVDRRGDDECWLWLAGRRETGYGQFELGRKPERKNARAHRVAYELLVGEIPSNMMLCHHCDNRACVNPRHLFIGTAADNARDMFAKGRGYVPAPRYGEAHHSAKFSSQAAAQAIADVRAGTPKRAVARRLGVDVRTVRSWVSGEYRADALTALAALEAHSHGRAPEVE